MEARQSQDLLQSAPSHPAKESLQHPGSELCSPQPYYKNAETRADQTTIATLKRNEDAPRIHFDRQQESALPVRFNCV